MTTYWEDRFEGEEIPPLSVTLGPAQLFMMSAVTLNPHRIHYDEGWAKHEGYEERVIHGPFHGEVIIQTLQQWLGTDGWLVRLEYSNRHYAVLGDTLTGRGRVTRVYELDGQHLADLEVHAERQDGQFTAPGTATVMLATRQAPITIPR
jgi:hydroxyacyl-ACP dehydratase HTD2-like protein with hotdog domain